MKLAIWVAVAVFLMILFLIVRHVFFKPSAPADAELPRPAARTALASCRAPGVPGLVEGAA